MALHIQSTHNGFKIVYDDTIKRYYIVSNSESGISGKDSFEFAGDAIEYALGNGYSNED